MARLPELEKFCKKHDLLLCTIADLIEYRLQQDCLIRRLESLPVDLPEGRFDLRVYETVGDPLVHIALCCGGIGELDPATKKALAQSDPVLVRMHSEHLLGDVFSAHGTHSSAELHRSLQLIQAAGKGALVYLRQESRGLALLQRLNHLRAARRSTRPVRPAAPLMPRRDFGIGGADPSRFGALQTPHTYESPEPPAWAGRLWSLGDRASTHRVIAALADGRVSDCQKFEHGAKFQLLFSHYPLSLWHAVHALYPGRLQCQHLGQVHSAQLGGPGRIGPAGPGKPRGSGRSCVA